jgi:uncharacterized protein (TIGR00369 family)
MDAEDGAPVGWRALRPDDPFNQRNGPFYLADPFEGDVVEPVRTGFRVAPHNCNYAGTCHGGVLAAVLDIALGQAVQKALDAQHAPTLSLVVDFMRPASPGEWLESRVRILKLTRSAGFCDGLLVGPHGNVARASGIFKRM